MSRCIQIDCYRNGILTCKIINAYYDFVVDICKENIVDDKKVEISKLSVAHLKKLILKEAKSELSNVEDANKLEIWRVEVNLIDFENNIFTYDDVKTIGTKMEVSSLKRYFDNDEKKPKDDHLHVIVVPPAGPSQQGVPLVYETTEEVLRKAESHWTELKDKLVKKIELEEFKVSDHIYKDSINASGIPVINNKPSFLLHSLPDNPESNDHEGYLHEEKLTTLLKNVKESQLVFLLGTSGSGKTRSLYELLCKTFGIYLSLSAGNGFRNLGSHDLDASISELGQYLTNDPEKNSLTALRFTRAILLGQLFILNKLLEGYDRNFTPKKWLLMQLLPKQIGGKDFWVSISRVFRTLPPVAIDESQVAITKHIACFPSSLNRTLRPFFSILLRTVIDLTTGILCLILSGTGMSFFDIENYTAPAIAKPGGATFKNFFSLHDGFYKCDEMRKFIRRFLPLDDKLIRTTFDIFRGRRRFTAQFLECVLLDDSSMSQSNINQIVKGWQDKAKNVLIDDLMALCLPRLREKREVWNKVRDIIILNMFSHCTQIVRGSGVSEMVQYGFAQLCSFENLLSLSRLKEDAITVRIAEPIPILAYREYLKKHPDEYETHLFQKLSSFHYNASCVGFLFESCCTILLAELFNAKTCKEHDLFTTIKNIDKLDSLLSCETTIRNFDNRNSTKIKMKDGVNLPSFLKNPTTAFFMPEKEAGPDLVCIVEFHTPNGIVEIPLFLQAELVKKSPGAKAKDTTNPYHFYPHGEKRTKSKQRLRNEVLACLKSKYCKAHELSWIRFIVAFPAKVKAESKYIINNKDPRPRREVASYNDSKANELLIVIDPSNIEHFFSKFGHGVLVELKRIANDDNLELELEPEENDELGLESEPEENDELELEENDELGLESEPEENDELKLEPEEKELKRIADNDELERETKMVRISDD
ncbi:hypothetical protein GLOIN_2v1558481 [Rhizophagus clarus]|uniref:Crinkler effector protein N-terminal domain-containing protein n=1 Tax=Rhizophagus clarus TaxID=94130 RepID=A0A8H3L6T0_9GLOM|nr:hypothetical protein GLOIN_2v1558481 [Rhizophagus clarus]